MLSLWGFRRGFAGYTNDTPQDHAAEKPSEPSGDSTDDATDKTAANESSNTMVGILFTQTS